MARAGDMIGNRLRPRFVRTVLVALAAIVAPVARSAAQYSVPTPSRYGEYRMDVISGDGETLHGGAGLTLPIGYYVRVGFIGAAGATWRDGVAHSSARTDVIARFSLDPFRQVPLGLSLGGGVSVPYEQGRRVRPYLTAVIDVEGKRRGAFTPALQIGLGGGARVGLVLRTSGARWR